MNRISSNIIHALILRQDLGWDCYLSFFHIYLTELLPMIGVKIRFLLNIMGTNRQNFTKFYICIDCIHIDKIEVRIVPYHF